LGTRSEVRPESRGKEIRVPLHERLLGNDPRIREIESLVSQLAQTNLTVLIIGETGTGKDIVARQLHQLSPRAEKPFIKVNCPSIPEGVFESELLGYERGAFTGAHTSRPGRFELAHGGTIFLDEICEAPAQFQGKLIQVLDGEPFMRIGGTTPVKADVRVVAATNIPLEEAISSGRVRKDVSFRLSEVVIQMPPLRERRGDIPMLVEHFNYNMSRILKKDYVPLDTNLVERLAEQAWPGNVRELAGRVKEYVATGVPDVLFVETSPVAPVGKRPVGRLKDSGHEGDGTLDSPAEREFISLKEAARRAADMAERTLIEETLRYTLWNRRKAAKLLKTSYSSLLRRIDAYEIGKS
jgi:DNA-binding NtrC family response regulator